MKNYGIAFIRALGLSLCISATGICVLAFGIHMTHISKGFFHMGTLAVYICSCLIGGYYIGRKVHKRQYLAGLIVGLLYYSVHIFLVMTLEYAQEFNLNFWTVMAILNMSSGMLGGLLS